ncbi:glycosyl transferase family 90 [Brucella sp. H1_1004]|uniref:glycosyl transferase family 90 n=1 Tax=Brucella sp. H1_1004 TaxID=3110109 RepID=UPI0039B45701
MSVKLFFSKFDKRRIEIYIAGVTGAIQNKPSSLPHNDRPMLCGTCETKENIKKRHDNILKNGLPNLYKTYIRQAQALFAEVAPRSCFSVYAADSRVRFESPTIVKSRLIKDQDAKGVLLPLDRKHHWNALLNLKRDDRPFESKDNKIIWRGVTTGIFQKRNPSDEYSQRFHVASLSNLADGIDLKYSGIVQIDDDTSDIPINVIKSCIGAKMTMAEQLSSKFLLSLEGNDVATGLKWMMASNSTVLMPTPTCETWFCESALQPWVHFIPVKQDLSDINEIYEWCLSNQETCRDIALNGKQYVRQFLNKSTEKIIIKEVVQTYLENFDEKLKFSINERIKQNYNYATLLIKAYKFSKSTEKWNNYV